MQMKCKLNSYTCTATVASSLECQNQLSQFVDGVKGNLIASSFFLFYFLNWKRKGEPGEQLMTYIVCGCLEKVQMI